MQNFKELSKSLIEALSYYLNYKLNTDEINPDNISIANLRQFKFQKKMQIKFDFGYNKIYNKNNNKCKYITPMNIKI